MKVLVFNGSPRSEHGNTALILTPFVEGMRECGAEVDVLYTSRLHLNPCLGDFNCWFKSPGRCHQQDDMQTVHPKLRAAEVWVFATPVYVWGVTGPMKILMDRMVPLVEPLVNLRKGHCSHPLREDTPAAKVVVVSNCGFWEMDNFHPLLAQFEMFCRTLGIEFAGALLRPHGPLLSAMLEMGAPVHDVLDAARDAGRQMVQFGAMSGDTLKAISRDLLPKPVYLEMLNKEFDREMAVGAGR